TDPDIGITQAQVAHAIWPAGAARNNDGFVIDVAPDATPHDATLVARVVVANGGSWEFDVTFPVGAPRVEIVHRRSWLFDPEPGGNRDGNANPGERVRPVLRLLNNGPSAARNVIVALEFDDPSVTVIRGAMSRARWEPGAAFTHNGFAIRIAPDAAPHDVTATVRVSADNGGPWEFPFVFSVAYRPVEFAQRNAWLFDPAPGGDGDGQAEAGERVFPRIRLRNAGVADATNVTVRLMRQEGSVAVVAGEVPHDSWPAGEARNNNGFVIEVGALAQPQDMAFTVNVQADGGVSWAFPYTFPITSPPVQLAVEDAWLSSGTARLEEARPGQTVRPRLRLRHVGTEPASGFVATLVATDDDIAITTVSAARDSLAPGEHWNITTLEMRIDTTATPHDTAVAIIIAVDGGGPWRFDVPVPMSAASGMRVRQWRMRDGAPDGNGDGDINPGETVAFHVTVSNFGTRQLYNVRTALTVDDPDITVTHGVETVADWPRSTQQSDHDFVFVAEVGPNASPHDIDIVLTMTADEADPFAYTWTLPIIALPPDFELRAAWVWEPAPGANADGDVDPGERVFPRVRLRNVGQGAGTNVHASLVILDADVEVPSGFVTHASWPVGEARNNNGLVVDISPDATPHDVQAVLSVTADDAGPWAFSFTIPVVAAQVAATALLANYPNPFNPETWISFDLSEAADVTVTVYNARGTAVRRLDLGRLAPGPYQGRADAAYWNGRNEVGEQASSGVYLYELRAGAHREMRRMVVR
ncbi:hypothetical protein HN937_10950, partial [Candidatus Poribacteria bacterium]|nr:hypothetical protein [Candidatus Poribacteria bacterium]